MHSRQIKDGSDLTNLVIVRHYLLEAERIEQLPLVVPLSPHHGKTPIPPCGPATQSRFATNGNRLLQQNLPAAASPADHWGIADVYLTANSF